MGRPSSLRRLTHALVAGVLLSCLRAPLGLDWTQVFVVQGSTAMLFRAAALLGIALSLDPARRIWKDGLGASWWLACAVGFVAHGLGYDSTPGSRSGIVFLLVAGTLLLVALAGPREAAAEGGARPESLLRSERLGLLVLGIGLALGFETLAHEVRLLTLATRADDAVVAGSFLLLVAAGALAFGPLLARLGSERARVPLGLLASTSAVLAGLLFLGTLSQSGLHGYLRRLDTFFEALRVVDDRLGGRLGFRTIPPLDGASIGTLWTTAILTAGACFAPAFLLGATVASTRNVGRLATVVIGSALGLLAWPLLVTWRGRPLGPEELVTASPSWEQLVAGVAVAALGATVVLARGPRPARTLALALAVALVPALRPRLLLWSFSPWSPIVVVPTLALPTGDGLLTVEPSRESRILTLDRRRLTPTAEEEPEDERRLRLAWALLGSPPAKPSVRALLVGQITPARAAVLRSLGPMELDRTAPWHAAMPAVEAELFRDQVPPPGRIVSPAAARLALKRGEYDWVVALPVRGPIVTWKSEARQIWGAADGPRMLDLALEEGTIGVAWLLSDTLIPRGASLAPLLLSPDRLDSLSLALVRGPMRAAERDRGPILRVDSLVAASPQRFTRTMPQQRPFPLAANWAASLLGEADAASQGGAVASELVRGLALHFAAQRLSSPYETRADQVEVDEEALRAFFAAVPAPDKLDRVTTELWETLAWLFTEKRMPEETLVYLEPLADRFAPWPTLDLAVARAYREVLEPETALRFLQRARMVRPQQFEVLLEWARCAQDMGDAKTEAELLEQAQAQRPDQADLQRVLALAWFRSGDPRGRPALEAVLAANPEDEAVRRVLFGAPVLPPEESNEGEEAGQE